MAEIFVHDKTIVNRIEQIQGIYEGTSEGIIDNYKGAKGNDRIAAAATYQQHYIFWNILHEAICLGTFDLDERINHHMKQSTRNLIEKKTESEEKDETVQ